MTFNPSKLTLYLVTDRSMLHQGTLIDLVRQAVDGGVTAVQLREKTIESGEFYHLALELKHELKQSGVPLIINDRVDVAAAVGVDGVHLGREDLPVEAAKKILGPDIFIGMSVNTPDEALDAQRRGAHYLGAGPAFSTTTKSDIQPVLGPEGLKRVVDAVRIPVIAIGGINSANIHQLTGVGLDGVALVSAICASHNPRREAAILLERFSRANCAVNRRCRISVLEGAEKVFSPYDERKDKDFQHGTNGAPELAPRMKKQ